MLIWKVVRNLAKYTMELRDIIKNGVNIFDFNYSFYDESKRNEFEEKFIRHFYFREIGAETIDRFKFYLEDKMLTVFPYYNELFKTSLIEYDKVYNYDMTETFKRNTENDSKQSGITSSVNQMFGTSESDSSQNRSTDISGTDIQTETGSSSSNDVNTSTNNTTENGTESASKNGTSNKDTKFLDTPQGLTDLSNSNYLTSLTGEDMTNSETSEVERSNTSNSSTNGTNEKSTEDEREINRTNTNNETLTDSIKNSNTDEQHSTNDSNTRMYSNGKQLEEYELTRRGNIGIQTASDMLEKHIELQKKLSKIEIMFFDECEDLFMLVF